MGKRLQVRAQSPKEKLSAKQSEWPAYYRELLAIYEAVQHFRHILETQPCTSQENDPELHDLLGQGSSLQLRQIGVPGMDIRLYWETSTARPRPFLTTPLRRQAFDSLHGLSHPGTKASSRLVSQRFVWPRMKKDCRTWACSCQQCQRAKVTPLPTSWLQQDTSQRRQRFQHVRIDIIGPLPPVGPYRYLPMAIDWFSRWPEAWPLKHITAEDIAQAFMTCWVSRFGSPARITTDQGRHFEADLFRRLAKFCGIHRSRTTSWHPVSNGMVERFHRQFKAIVMCYPGASWVQALPLVLLGIRSAYSEHLKACAAELVYGEPLQLPGELISSDRGTSKREDPTDVVARLQQQLRRLQPVPASRHSPTTTFVFMDLSTCSHVFISEGVDQNALQPPYSGPHIVVERDAKIYTQTNGLLV
uniref:Integrase catalytic domain-containing protein n=1 Tax=Trichuris muris TaxID=70415 RepID=A0A5S6QKW5_TRIMR